MNSELPGKLKLSLPAQPKTTATVQLTQNSFRHDEQCYLAQRFHVRPPSPLPFHSPFESVYSEFLKRFTRRETDTTSSPPCAVLQVQQVHPNRRPRPPRIAQGGGACRR